MIHYHHVNQASYLPAAEHLDFDQGTDNGNATDAPWFLNDGVSTSLCISL
jgi:hypothetical protein